MRKHLLHMLAVLFIAVSCAGPQHIGKTPLPVRFLNDPAISSSHSGISLYDPESRSFLYGHNHDKFFVPASNMKIFTLYAGLKYLGDSIPGVEYAVYNDTVFLRATGDPTFLKADFHEQPVFDFLKREELPLVFIDPPWETDALGFGWPWDNYLYYYMPERSPFPVYGNGILWSQRAGPGTVPGPETGENGTGPFPVFTAPLIRWPVEISTGIHEKFEVKRPVTVNTYIVYPSEGEERELFVPFATNAMVAALELLQDTLKKSVRLVPAGPGQPEAFRTLFSRPSDSLFRHMMVESDNLFGEQVLIMAGRQLYGVMDEKRVIDLMLEHDLGFLPQLPRWVDGSGLSRYNLASPLSMVLMLEKMADEFGIGRIAGLLPTGDEGTLEDLYLAHRGRIFAKTGTLGNAVALSGFLVTGKDRLLIFSVIINNHQKPAAEVRRAIERFLGEIIDRY